MRGGAVQPWRILRANADCALFIFLLLYTVFHSVIYNSVANTVRTKILRILLASPDHTHFKFLSKSAHPNVHRSLRGVASGWGPSSAIEPEISPG